MTVVIALLPVIITIASIIILNSHIARACTYGLLTAMAIASVQFGFPAGRVAAHLVHGLLSSWDILLLVAGGSLMGALLTANGTAKALSGAFAANGTPTGPLQPRARHRAELL
jgi:L-lactate permease